MITLFRRIRQKLIDFGSVTKYILYAVGEILLVVIGILIALQVNNWNEARKKTELTTAYLTQLKNELAVNLESSKQVADNLENKDSLLVRITRIDFEKEAPESFGVNLFFVPFNVATMVLSKDSYQNFIRSTDEVQFRDQELIDDIKYVYVDLDEGLRTTAESILKFIEDFLYSITDEQPWFHKMPSGDFPESLSEYVMGDPSYMNKVVLSKILYTGNHLNTIHSFQYRGYRLFQRLDSVLADTEVKTMDPGLMYESVSDSTADKLIGEYRDDDQDVEITINREKGELVLRQGSGPRPILQRYNGDLYVPGLNAVFDVRSNGDLYLYGENSYLLKKVE